MDAAPLVRLRWRLRGAWLWPLFVVLSLVDAVIVNQFPLTGNAASLTAGWLLGVILNLLAIVVLTAPITRLVRRLSSDMPRVVARDYAGAVAVIGVTVSLLSLGLIHRHVITNALNDLNDATARAEAYIGAHAPAQFQKDLNRLSTYAVQQPNIYRICASDPAGQRFYCVVVNRGKPFGKGVYYDGSESNTLLAQGTD
jgi:hypothetical protein